MRKEITTNFRKLTNETNTIKIQKNNILKINYNFFQRFPMLVALEGPRAF